MASLPIVLAFYEFKLIDNEVTKINTIESELSFF